ncbi:PD-(D/E)XK nuclease family protein [Pseudomonas guariconensis]|uniref:PD-(D/E)XK nuclease family protein n=1 Tax=Pseudomonas guariconensis TaxID=1288410 RepID=UPI003906A2FA
MNYLSHLANLTDSTVVLASTERVARHLKLQAALIQAAVGKKAWFAKGQILTVSSWIERVWLALLPDEQVLFPVQELATVKAVIDESGLLPQNMISSTNAARRVAAAYSMVYKYELELDPDRFRFKEEFEAFIQWAAQLDAICQSKKCVFRAHLPALLRKAVLSGEAVVPERIVIVGMNTLNPAEQALFDALRDAGAAITQITPAGQRATPRLVRSHNDASEMREVAQWVAERLEPYVGTPHAAPSLAIVVPDVRACGAVLLDALSLHAGPGCMLPSGTEGESKSPWDISSGATLGSRPMVRAAMDVLSLTPDKADFETFSRVLRSRWIGGSESESASRGLLDVWFRDNMGLNMGGNDFLQAIATYKGEAVPDFRSRFTAVLGKLIVGAKSRYPSEWADHVTAALEAIGWPGQQELDSASFQTQKAWDEALTMFRTLDAQLGTIKYERAYMWLREIVDTRQFQPRLSHVAPVSILSYEDAVGLTFDAVWVLGASNTVLPGRAEPSPFIPTDLQVDAGVHEASSDGMLALAQAMVGALLSASDDVTVSCPSHNEKGASIGASELFGSWPEATPALTTKGPFLDGLLGQLDRTSFEIESVPPVSQLELTRLKGGVRIFKDFAEAPFFSFARSRLRAEAFPVPIVGLDPRIQGTMVHKVLELFWQEVRTSKALKQFDTAALVAEVQKHVETASKALLYKLAWRYGKKLIMLEQRRIAALSLEWLELEKKRIYDFEVIGIEVRHDITVGDVPLTVTLDRRDRVFLNDEQTDWREIVHDYKTGQVMRMSSLNASSLTEPQLPIYATQLGKDSETVDGIALAQVNQASLGYHVRSNFDASLVAGRRSRAEDVDTKEKWSEQKTAWVRELDRMSGEFLRGNASLDLAGKAYPMGYEYLAQLAR